MRMKKQLKQFYTRLLNICNSEKAIREGVFFDLTYANLAGWVFNEHKQYAFLRKQDDELILIMVNFDSIPARSAVNIPQHAFDYLGIHRYGEYEATDCEQLYPSLKKFTAFCIRSSFVIFQVHY